VLPVIAGRFWIVFFGKKTMVIGKRSAMVNERGPTRGPVLLGTWLLLALLTAGCAGLGKPLEQPRINLANIRVEEMTGLETAFLVQLRVFNTNETDLRVSGIECDLHINDQRFATGVSKADVVIPSYGSELVSVTVYTSVFSMVRSMMRLPHHQELSYRLAGKLRLNDDSMLLTALPLKSEGKLRLEDITPRKNS
jgi:LEA14-like dessication related protein